MVISLVRRPRRVGRVLLVERGDHFPALVCRQVVAHRIVEPQLALLVEHHDAHGRDGLRHRGDAEHRVGGHRDALGDVLLAERLEIQNLILVRHCRDNSRDLSLVDGCLEHAVDRRGAAGV